MEVTEDNLRDYLDGKLSLGDTFQMSLVIVQNEVIRTRAETLIRLTANEEHRREREQTFQELQQLAQRWHRDILAAFERPSTRQDSVPPSTAAGTQGDAGA